MRAPASLGSENHIGAEAAADVVRALASNTELSDLNLRCPPPLPPSSLPARTGSQDLQRAWPAPVSIRKYRLDPQVFTVRLDPQVFTGL